MMHCQEMPAFLLYRRHGGKSFRQFSVLGQGCPEAPVDAPQILVGQDAEAPLESLAREHGHLVAEGHACLRENSWPDWP